MRFIFNFLYSFYITIIFHPLVFNLIQGNRCRHFRGMIHQKIRKVLECSLNLKPNLQAEAETKILIIILAMSQIEVNAMSYKEVKKIRKEEIGEN